MRVGRGRIQPARARVPVGPARVFAPVGACAARHGRVRASTAPAWRESVSGGNAAGWRAAEACRLAAALAGTLLLLLLFWLFLLLLLLFLMVLLFSGHCGSSGGIRSCCMQAIAS